VGGGEGVICRLWSGSFFVMSLLLLPLLLLGRIGLVASLIERSGVERVGWEVRWSIRWAGREDG